VGLSILITQCMQRDFIDPLPPHQPLPNALHVGREEAQRLLGADPSRGPMAQLMHWAREQPDDDLCVIHIRDWHDRDDPKQRHHLDQFGEHCIENTPGAELVLGLDEHVDERSSELFINATTLNDFVDTELADVLDSICSEHDLDDVRVGVIGVWTEAKVSFLLYELLTRCHITQLATCSALTASASRTQHFNALTQLRKILGVQVFDSVGEFASWLVPDGHFLQVPAPPAGMRPEMKGTDLSDEDASVVSYLYRDSARLALEGLSGGFSGASVFQVRSWDAFGHEQSSTVLKLGERSLIGKERVAFEQVEPVLGNDAPRVLGFADFAERAGIKYAYAAMGQGNVRTFKKLYESGISLERVEAILEEVFEEILGRFYAASQYERLPLLEYYTFDSKYADGVRAKVAAIYGDEVAKQDLLPCPDGSKVPNVADFYEHHLDNLQERAAIGEYHYVAYVHGDLNGANILLDGRDNVWLIDFFHAHRGHVLRDLAKFENDLLYIFTPVEDRDQLAQALHMSRTLNDVQDLRAPLPELPEDITLPQLRRAWGVLKILRRMGAKLVREDRDPGHLHTALLRYAVHTQWFDEASALQREWALAAAGMHVEALLDRNAKNGSLYVDWLAKSPEAPLYKGELGLTICPGRNDRGRTVESDLDALEAMGVTCIVGLLPEAEMEWAGVTSLPTEARARGIEYIHEPILDQRVPTLEVMKTLVDKIQDRLSSEDGKVVVHCMGGLGRSGTVAACALVAYPDYKESAPAAIQAVRDARSPRAVETVLQQDFVAEFQANKTSAS
jgi:protein-tyrosine phosphatase/nicotinamidase-related amidase